MAKAELVKRVVTSAKGIHCYNEDGQRVHAKKGDTVMLPPHAAKRFARYCEAPGVAEAKANVEAELAKADQAAEAAKPKVSAPSAPAKPSVGAGAGSGGS